MRPRVEFSDLRQLIAGIFLGLAVLFSTGSACAQGTLTVSAAASLKDVIVEVETVYKQSHSRVTFANNFGSSGTLAAQIDQEHARILGGAGTMR